MLDKFEKQGIIKLNCNNSKAYAFVVLGDSYVAIFWEKGGGNLSPIPLLCFIV